MRRTYVMGAVSMLCAACLALSTFGGCGGGEKDAMTIRVEGSDTMVNLAQAWAEEYRKVRPDVSVQVSGGGSGVGIASLIEGVADMANSSRPMKDKELDLAEQNTGRKPVEHIVGQDALAVYVHPDNPIDTISLEELADIYGEGGKTEKWSDIGIANDACANGEIIRVSRQNNSGTYAYFREAVLGKGKDFKLGSMDQSGSKDVVALISSTPCAIGYSGMGYKTDDVKWLKVTAKKGETGIEPSVASASDGSYPIARPLYIYTSGEPEGELKEFLDWIKSPAGQQVVLDLGYVPVGDLPGDATDSDDADSADADSEDSDSEAN